MNGQNLDIGNALELHTLLSVNGTLFLLLIVVVTGIAFACLEQRNNRNSDGRWD